MKKTKMLPSIIMLTAGSIACLMAYFKNYSLRDMLFIVLIVLIIFYCLGLIVKKILDVFTAEEEHKISDEGEVIEKQIDEEEVKKDETNP